MVLSITDEARKAKGRVALIYLMNLHLRLMENWRLTQTSLTGAPLDCESTLVVMAIVAIGTESLVRTGQLSDFEDLSRPMDFRLLKRCNVSSIAATTGLNRETVRRRVARLSEKGMVVKAPDGSIRIPNGILQESEVRECVTRQLEATVNAVEKLQRQGVLSFNSI